ncbi:MAG: helix-turn-helix transcriptional regulator [Oscillospiraceae bacterium]|nr:helix-turn-helix transcriptional regulator [Oscillospiraceae bacterium]
MMFWEKYISLCKKNNIKPRDIPKELNISPSTVTKWKTERTVPNRRTLDKIAERFNVTVDFLTNDEEISLDINGKRKMFRDGNLTALPQRFDSLHSGSNISNQELVNISEYVNASLYYLNNEEFIEYIPEKAEYDRKNLLNVEVLFIILNIMDTCADTDYYRTLQIQLSRIVLYHLADKGFTREKLSVCEQLSTEKLNFLYTGTKQTDITMNYGLNYSDLSFLCDFTQLSYYYMFTGVEGNFSDIVAEFYNGG